MSAPVAEHVMLKVSIARDTVVTETEIPKLIEAAEITRDMVKELETKDTIPGYIVYEEV